MIALVENIKTESSSAFENIVTEKGMKSELQVAPARAPGSVPAANTKYTGPNKNNAEDVPLLVSDNDLVSDCESASSKKSSQESSAVAIGAKSTSDLVSIASTTTNAENAAQGLNNKAIKTTAAIVKNNVDTKGTIRTGSSTEVSAKIHPIKIALKQEPLDHDQFKNERNQLMTIIVKYIATKIQNSFPPDIAEANANNQLPNELPLDKFLLILSSRLRLTLPMFMKGIIYLFRYMDIIYLLRYLNQSNNFANYTDMGFELKKLIVGCFKLAILREQRLIGLKVSSTSEVQQLTHNWNSITGLPTNEINSIVKKIIGRMNGKLNIKNIELVKLKSEIFRFVKMVAKEV